MGKQQEQQKERAPYATYTIDEFERLAVMGIWPGANVVGIGYVHQGETIPSSASAPRAVKSNLAIHIPDFYFNTPVQPKENR